MNVKYEHILFLVCVIALPWFLWNTMNLYIDSSVNPIRCSSGDMFLFPSGSDMWCTWPDGTSGFASTTYRSK